MNSFSNIYYLTEIEISKSHCTDVHSHTETWPLFPNDSENMEIVPTKGDNGMLHPYVWEETPKLSSLLWPWMPVLLLAQQRVEISEYTL